MNKQVMSKIFSLLTLCIPVIHLILFRFLFTRSAISAYGSLDALQAEDGWRGFMISEDIEPTMLCFSILCFALCLTISYMAYKKQKSKAAWLFVLIPIISIILMAFIQYGIEPNWVDGLVQYHAV